MMTVHLGGSYLEQWTADHLNILYTGGRDVTASDTMTKVERAYYDAVIACRSGALPKRPSALYICEFFRQIVDVKHAQWDVAVARMAQTFGESWWRSLDHARLPKGLAAVQPRLWDLTDYAFRSLALEEIRRTVQFDYTSTDCVSPRGAVCCGTELRLTLLCGTDLVTGADLVLDKEVLPCQRLQDSFSVMVSAPETPAVLFYHWVLQTKVGTLCLGARDAGSCRSRLDEEVQSRFQLTVYTRDFETPAWFQNSIMYQIFPDRFAQGDLAAVRKGAAYHESMGRKVELKFDWNAPIKWIDPDGSYNPIDYYGGTLKGIEARLPELRELGVGVLYLNPIFEADSNHRYNTADYMKIDPLLGTEADFRDLCSSAEKCGIRVMLDGVFSHTGSDSVYFGAAKNYDEPGAVSGPKSPYYSWYQFESADRSKYKCWWNFVTLPEVIETDPSWQKFIITDKDSVIRHWLRAGAAGYRLDVADELPDSVIELIRTAVKAESAENVVLGEVWEDATTKVSYDDLRTYALGNGLDSVMNYPLRYAVVDFALHRKDAEALCDFLQGQMLHYPEPMYRALMNLLSSHDVERIATTLGTRLDSRSMTREQQAAFVLSDAQKARGLQLQKLCAALIYMLPGVPSIYYGDETGMFGWRDPFNRGTWKLESADMLEFYKKLGAIRTAHPLLAQGDADFEALTPDVLLIRRSMNGQELMAIVNRSDMPYTLTATFSTLLLLGDSVCSAGSQVTVSPMSVEILAKL